MMGMHTCQSQVTVKCSLDCGLQTLFVKVTWYALVLHSNSQAAPWRTLLDHSIARLLGKASKHVKLAAGGPHTLFK